MRFKEQLIQNIVEPVTLSKLTSAVAQVLEYNPTHNVADIFIGTTKDGGNLRLDQVPVQISNVGIHQSALQIGDRVYVQFANGSMYQPKIVGKADELYATHTKLREYHLRQGELQVYQEKEDGQIQPSSETWVDSANTNTFKYSNYRHLNPIQDISEKYESIGNYKNQEIGMYNPASSSLIKILDDGSINIFTDVNNGIRINHLNRTIEFFGNITTNSKNWSVLSNNIEIVAKEKINIKAPELNLDVEKITKNGEETNVI